MFLFVQALFNLMFNGINMKKTNNKYRSGGNSSSNSTIYSLNYKFDSNSIAGKISGTALDLIKRYNDFAKDAQSNNDYVNAEIFRQYAEHYRKIVTEINERRNQQRQAYTTENSAAGNDSDNRQETEDQQSAAEENAVENDTRKEENATVCAENTTENKVAEETQTPVKESKKSFKIIEISKTKADEATVGATAEVGAAATSTTAKRVYRRRKTASSL